MIQIQLFALDYLIDVLQRYGSIAEIHLDGSISEAEERSERQARLISPQRNGNYVVSSSSTDNRMRHTDLHYVAEVFTVDGPEDQTDL